MNTYSGEPITFVPDMTLDVERNREELIEGLNRELEPDEDNEIPADESITTEPEEDPNVTIARLINDFQSLLMQAIQNIVRYRMELMV